MFRWSSSRKKTPPKLNFPPKRTRFAPITSDVLTWAKVARVVERVRNPCGQVRIAPQGSIGDQARMEAASRSWGPTADYRRARSADASVDLWLDCPLQVWPDDADGFKLLLMELVSC